MRFLSKDHCGPHVHARLARQHHDRWLVAHTLAPTGDMRPPMGRTIIELLISVRILT